MLKNRNVRFMLVFLIGGIVAAGIYYNEMSYQRIHPLIQVNEMNTISSTYVENDEVVLEIDASDNATCIKVNNVKYVINNNELFGILSRYKCKKSRIVYSPVKADDIVVEISLLQNHRPKHISLGRLNIWYESADRKAYEIIDGTKLLDEILWLVKDKQLKQDGE